MSDARARRIGALLVAGLLVSACAPALFSVRSYRGHRALDEGGLAALERLVTHSTATKAQVLTVLGPPVSVLGQDNGEIFVYRRVALDSSTIYLDPSYVVPSAPSIPFYSDSDVSGRDDLLMVFFDRRGYLRGASLRRGIGEVGGSRAATLSEGMRRWIE